MSARHPPAELRSPRAFARYRALVEAANRDPVAVHRDYDLTEAELTWDRLTAFEQKAFGLDPLLLNALVIAHVRYTEMIGLFDEEFAGLREEDRVAYPELFAGEHVYSMDHAIAFMAVACQLPQTQATMWVCRVAVQQIRSGLIEDDIAAPPWALGRT